MEVHHNTHSGKKSFKEYLLEGLMIFLAVTLGFIAENVRERISDNTKEKEYISGFIQNLRDDTTNLSATIKVNEEKLAALGRLMSLAGNDLSSAPSRKKLYQYCMGRSIGFISTFTSNDVTMQQLRNSGGFRYIKKQMAAQGIAGYEIYTHNVYAAAGVYTNTITACAQAAQELIDYSVYYDSTYFTNGAFTDKTLPLITGDPVKRKIFFNKVDAEISFTQNYLVNMKDIQPVAARLIAYLKQAYDLKNE